MRLNTKAKKQPSGTSRRNEKEEEKFWQESLKKQEENRNRMKSRINFVRKISVNDRKIKTHENESPVEVKIPSLDTMIRFI